MYQDLQKEFESMATEHGNQAVALLARCTI